MAYTPTLEDIDAAIARKTGNAAPSAPGKIGSAIIGASQGYSSGFGDELISGLAAGGAKAIGAGMDLLGFENPVAKKSLADIYTERLAKTRQGISRAREANPASFIAGDIGGAIASPVNKLFGGPGGFFKTVGQGVGIGALQSAGRSDSDSLAQTAVDAGIGGAIGGAASGIIYGAVKAITPLASSIAARIRGVEQADEGTAKAVQILLDAGKTPDEIQTYVRQAANSPVSGLPRTVFEESGSPAALSAQQVLTAGSGPTTAKGGQLLTEFNRIRQESAIPSVVERTYQQGASTTSPVTAGRNAIDTAGELIQSAAKDRTAAVAPQYAAVMGKKIPENWVTKLLNQNPVLKSEYDAAIKSPVTRQLLQDAERDLGIKIPLNSVGYLDVLKKILDGRIAESKTQFGESTAATKALTSARNRLVSALDDLNPKYAAARKSYGDESEFVNGLKNSLVGKLSGLKSEKQAYSTVFNDLPDKISEARSFFYGAGKGQQWDDLVASYVSNLDDASTGSAQSLLNKIGKNDAIDARLKAALGDDAYKGHRLLVANLKKIAAGSPQNSITVEKAQALKTLNDGKGGFDIAGQVDNRGVTARAIDWLSGKVAGGLEDAKQTKLNERNFLLAKALVSPDLAQYAKALKGIPQAQRTEETLKFIVPRLTGGIAGEGAAVTNPRPAGPSAGGAARSVGGAASAYTPTLEDIDAAIARKRTKDTSSNKPQTENDIPSIIQSAADENGLDPDLMTKIAQAESNLNPNAKAKTSSATGLFQITRGTWDSVGDGDPLNAEDNAAAAARLTSMNRDTLSEYLGREPDNGEIYLAHVFGVNGARKIIENKDSRIPAARLMPREARANRSLFFNGKKPRTAGELHDLIASKVM